MKKIIRIALVAFAAFAVIGNVEAKEKGSQSAKRSSLRNTPTVESYPIVLGVGKDGDNSGATSSFDKSFYIGAGAGTAFGISTFSTIGIDKTTPRVAAQVFGGYELSPLLSAELSVGYTKISSTTAKGTQSYYIAEGEAVFIPSPDAATSGDYAIYSNLESNSDLIHAEAKLNINLLGSSKSKWSIYVTPKVGYAYSSAKVDAFRGDINNTFVSYDQTASHFTMGMDLGAEYSFNKRMGLRLTTGMNYFTGDGIDGIPQVQYNSSYVMATTLNFVYRFK
ncbi:MAG: outer membrane beta-barrel protein [Rikenellaceae bacterium]